MVSPSNLKPVPPHARLKLDIQGLHLNEGLSRKVWTTAGQSLERMGVPEAALTDQLITHVAIRGLLLAMMEWLNGPQCHESIEQNITLEARLAAMELDGLQGSGGDIKGEIPLEP